MVIRSTIIGIFAYSLISLSSPNVATAQELLPSCYPVYGGGENCIQTDSIEVNKTVQNPTDSKFVENLGPKDTKFSPDQNIQFQITVKNTSGKKIDNIKLKDNLPQYLICETPKEGTCDNKNKVITIDIGSLNRNEARTLTIKAKITTSDKMQKEPATFCIINQAEAIQNKQSTQDNTQFCIQKNNSNPTPIPTQRFKESSPLVEQPTNNNTKTNQQPTPTQPTKTTPTPAQANNTTKGGKPVFPATNAETTPNTGPEILSLASIIPLAAAGFWLRRFKAGK